MDRREEVTPLFSLGVLGKVMNCKKDLTKEIRFCILESLRLQRAGPALRVFLLVDLPEIPLAVRLKAASLKAVVNLGLFIWR